MVEAKLEEIERDLRIASERFRVRVAALVLATVVVDAVSTVIAYVAEQGATDEFKTVWQSLFFCTTQLLTVSSSLPNPENAGTKVLDVFMEAWGVLIVAGGAAIVSDFLHHRTHYRLLSRRGQSS